MPDLDETVDQTEWQNYIRKSQDSLRVLADNTGGYAMVNTNDFDKGLKRIDAETSDYYVLGFYSNNPDPLRRNRRIEVKVTRKDVDVWARTQLLAEEQEDQGEVTAGRKPALRRSRESGIRRSGLGSTVQTNGPGERSPGPFRLYAGP